MAQADPPRYASKILKKVNGRSLLLSLNKIHTNLKNRQLPSGVLKKLCLYKNLMLQIDFFLTVAVPKNLKEN